MSPLPVRAEMKPSRRPSGESNGRDSFAGCETSSRASPPAAGTVQISPPETNAISTPSGESAGSVKYGCAAEDVCAKMLGEIPAIAISAKAITRHARLNRGIGLIIDLSKPFLDFAIVENNNAWLCLKSRLVVTSFVFNSCDFVDRFFCPEN